MASTNNRAHAQAGLTIHPQSTHVRSVRQQSRLEHKIVSMRNSTRYWRSQYLVWSVPRLRSRQLAGYESLTQQLRRWRRLDRRAWYHAQHPPDLKAFMCIHHYEGSWQDPNAPYWGGLQMDLTFQRTYGPYPFKHKGTADHWTPLQQIWVAERAVPSRGFNPWPNTARDCGLLP